MIILLTGGGTAGHVTPNIALIQLLHPTAEIHYIGTNGMEQSLIAPLIPSQVAQYHTITAHKLTRHLSPSLALLPFRLLSSIHQAKAILKKVQPDVVFGKGGYVSLPVAIASKQLSIPVIMHESDYSLGLANKIASRYCTTMLSTFPNTKHCQHIGGIIRQDIYYGNKAKGLSITKFGGTKPILTVMGGSLGAGQLNDLIMQCQPLSKLLDIFVITGKGKSIQCDFVHQREYVTNMASVYAVTNIALTRGGANSLLELTTCNIPFVAIPLTNNSRGEQVHNCSYFVDKGCGIMLLGQVTARQLMDAVINITNNYDTYKNSCNNTITDATKDVASLILTTAKR